MKAFVGLLYYGSVLKQNKLSAKDTWSELYGCSIFRCVMNERKFVFLLSMIRFDDKITRAERRAADKLASIREIWERFSWKTVKNITSQVMTAQLMSNSLDFEADVLLKFI